MTDSKIKGIMNTQDEMDTHLFSDNMHISPVNFSAKHQQRSAEFQQFGLVCRFIYKIKFGTIKK